MVGGDAGRPAAGHRPANGPADHSVHKGQAPSTPRPT